MLTYRAISIRFRTRTCCKSLARRISDRRMLRLLKMWLKTPVAERTEGGGWRLSGGKLATRGTPQGGVISPLIANVYIELSLSEGLSPPGPGPALRRADLRQLPSPTTVRHDGAERRP